MQFAKVQGGALAALGLLLLLLQVYILFSSTRQSGSPTQAPAAPTQGEQIAKFVPGGLGLLALGLGGYFMLLQRKPASPCDGMPDRAAAPYKHR
jgi:hypothetical protein